MEKKRITPRELDNVVIDILYDRVLCRHHGIDYVNPKPEQIQGLRDYLLTHEYELKRNLYRKPVITAPQ